VLIDETFKETKTYTSVLFLPQIQTSYTYGHVNAYSSNGSAYGNYSATTTTTTMQPVSTQKDVDIFNQTVMFMRKADFSDFFGAILYAPKRVPGVNDNEYFGVTILAILRGSEAERKGLKKGQKVVKINNQEIKTRKDYAQFLNNPNTITSIEVAQ
jgi:S1-C subfamily serine protease